MPRVVTFAARDTRLSTRVAFALGGAFDVISGRSLTTVRDLRRPSARRHSSLALLRVVCDQLCWLGWLGLWLHTEYYAAEAEEGVKLLRWGTDTEAVERGRETAKSADEDESRADDYCPAAGAVQVGPDHAE